MLLLLLLAAIDIEKDIRPDWPPKWLMRRPPPPWDVLLKKVRQRKSRLRRKYGLSRPRGI